MKQRLISIMLVCLMIFTILPMTVSAADDDAVKIEFETVTVTADKAAKGSIVEVKVSIVNNPGFVSATIPVTWNPEQMKLLSVKDCDIQNRLLEGTAEGIGENSGWIGYPVQDAVPGLYHLAWNNDVMHDGNFKEKNFTKDDYLCVMVFELAADMAKDAAYDISADLGEESFINLMNWDMQDYTEEDENLNSTGVTIMFGSGGVKMTEVAQTYILGDVDGDKKITTSDASAILRYIVGYTDAKVNMAYGDVDGDEKITTSDASAILRYIVGYTDNPDIGKTFSN